MSRTRRPPRKSYIEVVKRDDATYDLFNGKELVGGKMEERWLRELLCVRFGYCQDEGDLILLEVNRNGRARPAKILNS